MHFISQVVLEVLASKSNKYNILYMLKFGGGVSGAVFK